MVREEKNQQRSAEGSVTATATAGERERATAANKQHTSSAAMLAVVSSHKHTNGCMCVLVKSKRQMWGGNQPWVSRVDNRFSLSLFLLICWRARVTSECASLSLSPCLLSYLRTLWLESAPTFTLLIQIQSFLFSSPVAQLIPVRTSHSPPVCHCLPSLSPSRSSALSLSCSDSCRRVAAGVAGSSRV